ncbi:MAG: hypothetical protein EAZ36_04350 [Verrucomicrobia bacterium]|nr:MAG: hypothetical protein EAZ36_04350 [Verrucomicrobiota bacterium]
MDWIWDNFQLILVVAGSIAYWLNQRQREKNGEPADYDQDGIPENRVPPPVVRELTPANRDGQDPEQDDRVRRIQEEIRRKIAQRRGQDAPPPLPAPEASPFDPFRPVFTEEPVRPQAPPSPPVPTASPPLPASPFDDQEAVEQQRRLAEQVAELDRRRREARRAAQALAESGVAPVTARDAARAAKAHHPSAVLSVRSVKADLRDPKSLRRAVILREILDKPIALR